ncbi:MAG: hypothetical protein LBB59_03625 [Campylobacteraceae bacterium]|jgi:hypothetical protein|nr:hypothetical protein [Campylobacteraceae bacterium]
MQLQFFNTSTHQSAVSGFQDNSIIANLFKFGAFLFHKKITKLLLLFSVLFFIIGCSGGGDDSASQRNVLNLYVNTNLDFTTSIDVGTGENVNLSKIAADNRFFYLYEAGSDVNLYNVENFTVTGSKNLYSAKNVIEITGIAGLRDIKCNDTSVKYVLLKDIVLNGGLMICGGAEESFGGLFNGDFHTISGLRLTGTGNVGLFSGIYDYSNGLAMVRNLGVIDAEVTGSGNVGIIAGNILGNIVNSYSTGKVLGLGNGTNAGGIAGNILGYQHSGYYTTSRISGSYSTAVVSTVNGTAGGIAGSVHMSNVDNSYSTGSIFAGGSIGLAGGITGSIGYGTIGNSYSTGSISGAVAAGGISGSASSGYYSNGVILWSAAINSEITAPSANTISGTLGNGSGYNNIASNAISLPLVLSNGISGTLKALDEFKQKAAYTDLKWDFEKIWKMPENGGYPILRWQER